MEVLKVSIMPHSKKLSDETFCLTDGNLPSWKMYHNDYAPFHEVVGSGLGAIGFMKIEKKRWDTLLCLIW
jgi:hypothetical protein